MKTKIIFQTILEVDFPEEYKRINSIKWTSKAQKERILKLVELLEEKKYKECMAHYRKLCNLHSKKDHCWEAEFAPVVIRNCFQPSGFVDRILNGHEVVEKEQPPLISNWRGENNINGIFNR